MRSQSSLLKCDQLNWWLMPNSIVCSIIMDLFRFPKLHSYVDWLLKPSHNRIKSNAIPLVPFTLLPFHLFSPANKWTKIRFFFLHIIFKRIRIDVINRKSLVPSRTIYFYQKRLKLRIPVHNNTQRIREEKKKRARPGDLWTDISFLRQRNNEIYPDVCISPVDFAIVTHITHIKGKRFA